MFCVYSHYTYMYNGCRQITYHRYSHEAKRGDQDIYDDFKLKITLCYPWFIRKYLSALRVKIGILKCACIRFYDFISNVNIVILSVQGLARSLQTLNFVKTMETKVGFSIRNHHECLSWLFQIHLNTYVMGLRPVELLQYGDRQNLTSTDVRF